MINDGYTAEHVPGTILLHQADVPDRVSLGDIGPDWQHRASYGSTAASG
jgi:hypothetical protein